MPSNRAALLMLGMLCGTCAAENLETVKNESGLRFSEKLASNRESSQPPVAAGAYKKERPALILSPNQAPAQTSGTNVPLPETQKAAPTRTEGWTSAKIAGAAVAGASGAVLGYLFAANTIGVEVLAVGSVVVLGSTIAAIAVGLAVVAAIGYGSVRAVQALSSR